VQGEWRLEKGGESSTPCGHYSWKWQMSFLANNSCACAFYV